MRDPRTDPWPGDVVEKIGKRYVPVRRFVLRREGMKVYFQSEGKTSELEAWLSTWMEWCGDSSVLIIAPTKPPESKTKATTMKVDCGDFAIEQHPHYWIYRNRRVDPVELTYHSSMAKLLVFALEQEVEAGGDTKDIRDLNERLEHAIEKLTRVADKIEGGRSSDNLRRPIPSVK